MILLIAGLAAVYFLYVSTATSVAEAVAGEPERVTVNKTDFSVMLFNSLRRHLEVNSALLATAMGVLESGYGKTTQYKDGYNVFNTTDWVDPKGIQKGYWVAHGGKTRYTENADWEVDPVSGTRKRIGQNWRIYTSLDEAVDDYISFLRDQNGKRYAAAFEILRSNPDPDAFVSALYSAGYFTEYPDVYVSGIKGTLETVKTMNGVYS